MTTTVKIAIDDEGMISTLSSEEIAALDIEETYSKFLADVVKEIKAAYPGVEVETSVGPTTYATKIFSDEIDEEEIGYMEENIGEITSRIYDRGEFWANKNF